MRDELEFSISQYVDGTLAGADRDALDERFATDADARALLAEYESLQTFLTAPALPPINWDRFAAEVSASVAREELPAQSYKISQWFRPAWFAVAASVLIVGAIGFSVLRPHAGNTPANPIAIRAIDDVTEDVVAVAPSTTIQIAIGPSDLAQDQPILLRYADSVVQRPSNALIVSAARPAQDSALSPF